MSLDPCEYCGSGRVVPVLDKRIERSPTAGNKFRTRCRNCWRWLPMTSKQTYRNHPEPHVLPADADPAEEGSIVPLEDYDYADEWADLAERVSDAPDRPVRADGGPDVTNQFVCPAIGCQAEHEGFPDECDDCGARYDWNQTTTTDRETQQDDDDHAGTQTARTAD